jgi:hypothetical protein
VRLRPRESGAEVTALQTLARLTSGLRVRAASWSAAALRHFRTHVNLTHPQIASSARKSARGLGALSKTLARWPSVFGQQPRPEKDCKIIEPFGVVALLTGKCNLE